MKITMNELKKIIKQCISESSINEDAYEWDFSRAAYERDMENCKQALRNGGIPNSKFFPRSTGFSGLPTYEEWKHEQQQTAERNRQAKEDARMYDNLNKLGHDERANREKEHGLEHQPYH